MAETGGFEPFDPGVTPGMSTNLLAQSQAPAPEPKIFVGFKKVDGGSDYMLDPSIAKKVPDQKVPVFLTMAQVMSRFDNQDREDFVHLRKLMVSAGIVSPGADPYTVRSAFASVLGDVAEMSASGVKLSPMGYIRNLIQMNGGPGGAGAGADGDLNGDGIPDDFTGTKKGPVNRSVTEISEGQAWASLRGTVSQMIGRDPTDDELRKFTYRMNSLAAANPAISQTIARYKNGEVVSSRTHTDPGFTSSDVAESAYERAQNEPDYAEYQAATTYFNAAQTALGAIGSTAGGLG